MSLKIEAFGVNGSEPTVITDMERILIRDKHDNPIALVVTWGENGLIVAHVNDADFDSLLRTFGTESVTVLQRIHIPKPQ